MNDRRCFDCFAEFGESRRYLVLKQMRDVPTEEDPQERAVLERMSLEAVFVCEDCAGWYGDDVFTPDDDDGVLDARHGMRRP